MKIGLDITYLFKLYRKGLSLAPGANDATREGLRYEQQWGNFRPNVWGDFHQSSLLLLVLNGLELITEKPVFSIAKRGQDVGIRMNAPVTSL